MKISVVIPTLNEASRIAALVSGLRRQDPGCDVVVVDGGSSDTTLAAAQKAGARTLHSLPGRGRQLALGAEQARGDVILFLHADTRFPDNGLAAIATQLQESTTVGGNFRIVFDGGTDFARWLTGFYAWFRRHGLYYGDSAIFVRRATYRAMGGIRPLDLMEDYDFTRRLERQGRCICIQEPPVRTSSRRFAGRHPVSIVTGWLVIHALFHIGLSPRLLARLYDSRRRRTAH